MLKVGLTGGYASGKSFVARELEELGCHLVYADKLGHQALQPNAEAYRPTLSLFGDDILNPDLTINRKKLAAIVFNSPDLLSQLNAIVHPAVFRLEQESLIGFESQNPRGIAIVEAAILIETGRYRQLDRLIVTSCAPEIQIGRAMARDNISREEAQNRLARQLSNDERVLFANYVIDTNGTCEETVQQVTVIYSKLRQLAEASPS